MKVAPKDEAPPASQVRPMETAPRVAVDANIQLSGSFVIVEDPADAEELPPGIVVGDYVIECVIGRGGMGTVYGARHPMIGKRAAIKVLNGVCCADRIAVARFIEEARSVNRIGHADIVDVFAFGALGDGRSYLVMEWLQGETLQQRLDREHRMSAAEAAAILIPLTRALEAAHAAGVIHRDLKPDNVFLVPEEDTVRVKLLDFGVAKLSTPVPASRTQTGTTVGTPLFMSPEQARGSDVCAGSDTYSLGTVAYAMVCGVTPFEHEGSAVEILHGHLKKEPRPPREHVADLPASFDLLVLDMLAKFPDRRPSLADVRRRLRALLDPGDRAQLASSDAIPSRPAPRRWRVVLAATFAVVVATGFGGYPWLRRDAVPLATVAAVAPPRPAPDAPARGPEPAAAARVVPPVRTVGTVDLAIDPPGATVMIDGAAIALDGGRVVLELPAGDHALTVALRGHITASRSFAIVASQVTPLTIKLQRPARVVAPPPRASDPDGVVDPFARKRRGP